MKSLDTSVAVDHLRGKSEATELLRLSIMSGDELLASEIVRLELLAGARQEELPALEGFFGLLIWIPADENVVRIAGSMARKYRKAFSGIDTADYIIAATALYVDAPLLTTNVKHFPMFDGLVPAYQG